MEAKGRIVATEKGTEGKKELERKPSLQHSISKDDEKMKVKELITDRSTIAVEELKQDVIKANSIPIKSAESEETNQIAPTTDNGGQKYTADNDFKTESGVDKSTDKNDTHQDISSIDNKDRHKNKQNQIYELKLESTDNDNLKLDSNNGDKNSASKQAPTEEIVNVEYKHKVDNIDSKDEQNLGLKLNQPTDHESNLKLDSKTDSDLLSSKEIEKECSKKDKETSENKNTDETKADPNKDLQIDTKSTEENKKTKEEPEMDCKKIMKNVKENSSQERKVKMIKKKKKKSPITEEPSEIQFDELLLPKEIEKGPEKTENSYIVEEPDNEEKVKLNVHQDRESVEISEEKPDTEEKVHLIVHPEKELDEISEVKSEERSPKPWPTGEKTSDDLSPIPAKESKSPENPKIDVTLKQTPIVDEPAFSNFELEEVELKSKSSKVKKDVNEVYLCSMGIKLMKLTKHVFEGRYEDAFNMKSKTNFPTFNKWH